MSGGLTFTLFLCCICFILFAFITGDPLFAYYPALLFPPAPRRGAPCPGQAASLPLCWLLPEVGSRLDVARAAWGRGNNKGKQRIPLQKAGEEGRWPVSVGREDKEPGTMGAPWSTNARPSHYPPIAQTRHAQGLHSASPESEQGRNGWGCRTGLSERSSTSGWLWASAKGQGSSGVQTRVQGRPQPGRHVGAGAISSRSRRKLQAARMGLTLMARSSAAKPRAKERAPQGHPMVSRREFLAPSGS